MAMNLLGLSFMQALTTTDVAPFPTKQFLNNQKLTLFQDSVFLVNEQKFISVFQFVVFVIGQTLVGLSSELLVKHWYGVIGY